VNAGGTNALTLAGYVNVTNPPPPDVEFNAAPTVGLAPLSVSFTSLATGGTNYGWEFGDSEVSAIKDVSHTYTNAGTYSVTFTVIGPGGTNSLTKPTLIIVTNPPLPTVDFAAAPRTGFLPLTVYFTNLATGGTNFTWTFGDGESSTEKDPGHTYTNAGSYDITLTATGPGGTKSATYAAYIVISSPPVILSPAVVGEDFIFSFETIAGKNYKVEFKDSLDDATWQTLQALPGDGNTITITNSLSVAPQRFFRLRVND
jgi:PKD repeat protein